MVIFGWILLFIVAALTALAIVLVLILSIKRYQKNAAHAAKTAGSGTTLGLFKKLGALGPPIKRLVLLPLAIVGAVWAIKESFPVQYSYYLERGGPEYPLFYFAAILVILLQIPYNLARKWLVIVWVGIWSLPFMWALGGTILFGKPSPPGTALSDTIVRRAPSHPCDNVYRDYPISVRPSPIPGSGCKLGWNVLEGAVVFIDRRGTRYGPYRKDDVVGDTPPAIEWQAAKVGTIVRARLY